MERLSLDLQIMLYEAAKRGRAELKMIICFYPSMPDGGTLEELDRVISEVEAALKIDA